MYNKEIYQEWEMHHDATQLEIKYKFLLKAIDALSIKALVKNINNISEEITDIRLIKQWQSYELAKILNQFYLITNDAQELKDAINQYNLLEEKIIFLLGIIINILKKTNYKANELEIYYEPRLIAIAQKNLNLLLLEKWVSELSNRIYASSNLTQDKKPINLRIYLSEFNINNVIWYVENLCLSFKEIAIWYNNLFAISNMELNNKKIAINIMNHLIVYYLTDFYIKLTFLYSKNKNFNLIYSDVLSSIKYLLNNGNFAINAYKEIAIFLSKLLIDGYISYEDDIINNFLEIIDISCSYNNKKYFEQLIFERNDNEIKINQNDLYDNDINESSYNVKSEKEIVEMNHKQSNFNENDDVENNDNKKDINNDTNNVSNFNNIESNSKLNNQTTKFNEIIKPTTSFKNETQMITKNLQNQFSNLNKQEFNDETSEDKIQEIINRKTSNTINLNKYKNFNNNHNKE